MQPFDHVRFWRDPAAAPKEMQEVYGKQYKFALPEFYLNKVGFSGPILTTVEKYAQKDWTILEIGSGTGRNLSLLIEAGYKNVSGIEINPKAIALGRKYFPNLQGVPILCDDIGNVARDIQPVDIIFSRGCFMHIPYDWVFPVLAEKAQKIIMTSDDEENIIQLPSRIKRDYVSIFEPLGWELVETQPCDIYPPLPPTTIKRVFRKVEA